MKVFYWTILIDHVSNSGHDWKVAELDLLVFIRRLSGLCWRFSGFRSRRLSERERLRKRSSNRLNRLLIYFLLMDCLEKWHPSSWMKYSLSLTTILPLYSFLPFPIFWKGADSNSKRSDHHRPKAIKEKLEFKIIRNKNLKKEKAYL